MFLCLQTTPSVLCLAISLTIATYAKNLRNILNSSFPQLSLYTINHQKEPIYIFSIPWIFLWFFLHHLSHRPSKVWTFLTWTITTSSWWGDCFKSTNHTASTNFSAWDSWILYINKNSSKHFLIHSRYTTNLCQTRFL